MKRLLIPIEFLAAGISIVFLACWMVWGRVLDGLIAIRDDADPQPWGEGR